MYILDDTEAYIQKFSKTCTMCKHLINNGIDRRCKAFPGGIPMAIWMSNKGHRRLVPGDGGIMFERITERK